VLPLHVDIPVVVEHDGQRKESRAVMTGGICPLTFKTTGIDVGGRTFQIEGTSAPRARLTIGLEKFHAGQDGHFSFRFESEQPSQLEIVARTDELLPRRAALNISR
jgi:hypothetical protein